MILSYLLEAQDLWTPVKFGATVLSSKDNNLKALDDLSIFQEISRQH